MTAITTTVLLIVSAPEGFAVDTQNGKQPLWKFNALVSQNLNAVGLDTLEASFFNMLCQNVKRTHYMIVLVQGDESST